MTQQANSRSIPVFDEWSKTFDGDRISSFFREMQDLVLQHLNLGPNDRLLDVGCGTGWAVEHATQRCNVGRAVGVDLSPGMISRAREHRGHLPNVEFQCADAESLPFDDESFDGGICTFSFHHYSSPVKALSEMKRVLRPGGSFCILDNNRASFCGLYGLWDLYFRWTEPGHVRYLTPPELTALFKEAQFDEVELIYKQSRLFHGKKIFGSAMIVRGRK